MTTQTSIMLVSFEFFNKVVVMEVQNLSVSHREGTKNIEYIADFKTLIILPRIFL